MMLKYHWKKGIPQGIQMIMEVNMKLLKRVMIMLVLASCCLLAACNQQNNNGNNVAPAPTPADISEKAMNNFVAKIRKGDYTVVAPEYQKITVFSQDLVYFDFVPERYKDFAAMSVNNEVFQSFYNDSWFADAEFVQEGTAMEAAASRTLNHWINLSQGNMFELFYNLPEEPLKFMSNDTEIKYSLASLAGYDDRAVGFMHEIYLVMDSDDPMLVHVLCQVDDDEVARRKYDDIDLQVVFGNATEHVRAAEWMKNPRYPQAPTTWSEDDIMVLDSIFLAPYGVEAVPFPQFASYALKNDRENFVWNDAVTLRDSHATEKDVDDYIASLLKNGYKKVEELNDDGTTTVWYRKLLREEFKCYASLNINYDKGFNLYARRWYDCPEYYSFKDINKTLKEHHFLPLAENDVFKSYYGIDGANDLTEGWIYFYIYEMNMQVDLKYEDHDQAIAQVNAYIDELLANGYRAVTDSTTGEIDHYQSPDGYRNFRYREQGDDMIQMLFKGLETYTAEEANELLKKLGFPEIHMTGNVDFRDKRLSEMYSAGKVFKAFYQATQYFASQQEAEAFLDAYAAVADKAGYERVVPASVESSCANVLYNEKTNMYVGIDVYPTPDNGAQVDFVFAVR